MSSAQNNRHKTCGVCGDIAKSYHFGGLCCDSCKAFFRRTVQSQAWEVFLCVTEGSCKITKNRRSCQACRFELCKKIGMDSSMVMNIEERKALMLRKLERRKEELLKNRKLKELKQAKKVSSTSRTTKNPLSILNDEHNNANTDWSPNETHKSGEKDNQIDQDEVDSDCIIICSSSARDQENIRFLQGLLREALSFPEFPKYYYEEDADVADHLFFMFCKGMGKFFSLVPEFREIELHERSSLLKDVVLKAAFVFGAHQFDKEGKCWPRRLLSPCCTFPKVTLASVTRFIGNDETFSKLEIFMEIYKDLFEDEIVTLLSMLIAGFNIGDAGVTNLKISQTKSHFVRLLENYLQHRKSSTPIESFWSELKKCLSDMQELIKRLLNDQSYTHDSESFENKVIPGINAFRTVADVIKTPTTDAHFGRIKLRELFTSTDVLLEDYKTVEVLEDQWHSPNESIVYSDEDNDTNDHTDISHVTQNPYVTVNQDHNYQKSDEVIFESDTAAEERYGARDMKSPTKTLRHVSESSLRIVIPKINGNLNRKSQILRTNEPDITFPSSCSFDEGNYSNVHKKGFVGTSIRYPTSLAIPVPGNRKLNEPEHHQRYTRNMAVSQCISSLHANNNRSRNSQNFSKYQEPSTNTRSAGNKRMVWLPYSLKEPDIIARNLKTNSPDAETGHGSGIRAVPFHMNNTYSTNINNIRDHYPYQQINDYRESQRSASNNFKVMNYSEETSRRMHFQFNDLRQIQTSNLCKEKSMFSPQPIDNNDDNEAVVDDEDDEQLVRAVQNALPAHLAERLFSRLGDVQKCHD